MTSRNDFPQGWDAQRVQGILDHYEHQGDEEAATEHETALANPSQTLMEVPVELVSMFRQLIAEHQG